MIIHDVPPERRPDVQAAMAQVGYEARPTGRLRLLQTASAARLQQEWRGEYGTVWLNVPVVQVDELPPRWVEAMPPEDAGNGEERATEGSPP
ncbi:hypothetical protein MKK75_03020 [Methylobacterium sp. J-030]|uniref:hypothetical protein n=1 Tax=Methylobacterium sp. J-030 TaxID=2836627 RepID=UPI001FB8778C|nr:hypothetical protein [Methylobacterium sp. J-030]MCJ2067787.1 hypothetical protein [Methylobacterium sp. J-030]